MLWDLFILRPLCFGISSSLTSMLWDLFILRPLCFGISSSSDLYALGWSSSSKTSMDLGSLHPPTSMLWNLFILRPLCFGISSSSDLYGSFGISSSSDLYALGSLHPPTSMLWENESHLLVILQTSMLWDLFILQPLCFGISSSFDLYALGSLHPSCFWFSCVLSLLNLSIILLDLCRKGSEDSLLSWHGSHFWVCITFCKFGHSDSVTKPVYYYYLLILHLYLSNFLILLDFGFLF